MRTFKLVSPNPDMNGANVQGYDRVERNKEDGYFHVHDSNLADKLRAAPWNFTDAPVERAAAPAKKVEEEKTLEQMDRKELTAWLVERGHTPGEDISDADLLAAAQLVKEEADKKSKSAGGGKKK